MLKVGGYVMSYADAKAWAERRYPGIDFYDERLIPHIIQRHNKNLGGKLKCMGIYKADRMLCLFVTHAKQDPNVVNGRFERFIEDEETLQFKRMAFTNREDWEKAMFATILDPYNLGY